MRRHDAEGAAAGSNCPIKGCPTEALPQDDVRQPRRHPPRRGRRGRVRGRASVRLAVPLVGDCFRRDARRGVPAAGRRSCPLVLILLSTSRGRRKQSNAAKISSNGGRTAEIGSAPAGAATRGPPRARPRSANASTRRCDGASSSRRAAGFCRTRRRRRPGRYPNRFAAPSRRVVFVGGPERPVETSAKFEAPGAGGDAARRRVRVLGAAGGPARAAEPRGHARRVRRAARGATERFSNADEDRRPPAISRGAVVEADRRRGARRGGSTPRGATWIFRGRPNASWSRFGAVRSNAGDPTLRK